jgi:hypothetical protein
MPIAFQQDVQWLLPLAIKHESHHIAYWYSDKAENQPSLLLRAQELAFVWSVIDLNKGMEG